jgi:hypothetical protein
MEADMRRVPHFVVIAFAASASVGGWGALVAQESPSAAAFGYLTSLVGRWKGVFRGTDITLTYTLTADGSALMEEARPKSEPAMVTMFTVDGDRLVATHYCSARNQPHMKTEAITRLPIRELTFTLDRVTGMRTPDDWHNTGLVITLDDNDHLTENWTYQVKGETGKNIFHFTREPKGGGS